MRSEVIKTQAGHIERQLRAGIPLNTAIERMAQLDPKRADTWQDLGTRVGRGVPLSDGIGALWPSSLVEAVRAGENAGALEDVLAQVQAAMAAQQRTEAFAKKLAYPGLLVVGGIAVSLFFLIKVIPSLKDSLSMGGGGMDLSGFSGQVFKFSEWLNGVFWAHPYLFMGTGIALVVGVAWLVQNPRFRLALRDWALNMPYIGPGVASVSFAIYGQYVALLDQAGIDADRKIGIPLPVLPPSLQAGMEKVRGDIVRRGLGGAIDTRGLPESDPRHRVPFLFAVSFQVAAETGNLAAELSRSCPALQEEGEERIQKVLTGANYFAIAFAAMMIMAPLGAYYLQMAAMTQNMM